MSNPSFICSGSLSAFESTPLIAAYSLLVSSKNSEGFGPLALPLLIMLSPGEGIEPGHLDNSVIYQEAKLLPYLLEMCKPLPVSPF